MAKSREDYAPDVGGFLDNVDVDITKVSFAVATGEYADKILMGGGDQKPPVVMTVTYEGPELEKPREQSYSVGNSELWEVSDDGSFITNKKDSTKHGFRRGSRAYSLIEAMFLAVGGASEDDITEVFTNPKLKKNVQAELEKGQDFFIKRDAFMTENIFAEGLSFHMVSMKLPTVEGKEPSSVPLPVKFLGDKKPSKGKVVPAGKKTVATTNDALDKIIIETASGKTDKEIKVFAVRHDVVKKDAGYLKGVVDGSVLKRLEDAGSITKDPESGKFI